MTRDPRYDILFEPVQLGPVTARNRFYQVPHCAGMGHTKPHTAAAMRGAKAEGGWAVVSTEECEIHHTSDVSPYSEQRLWDDSDIPNHALMVDAVHEHGALAAIELAHNGIEAPNQYTRSVTIAPSGGACPGYVPIQARAMTDQDIRDVRKIYRDAALRAKRAGFDVIYVYSGHGLTLPTHFLSKKFNRREDEYGGSLSNRMRLLRELIEDAKDAVGDTCAIAVRISVDESWGADNIEICQESIDVIGTLAELPDLWDVNLSRWEDDSATSRFKPEGFQQQYIQTIKELTTKPVVGVGRFTSPDTMASQIRQGTLDMIGAARPSIADPFLPKKIEEGRIEDIRECIGCNICITGDFTVTPMRCTQNPTVGEEWRRDWHPEIVPRSADCESILIIGGGPAGLECASILAKRGCRVTLAEASIELGGRVGRESSLPGLSAWARVRDYRLQQIGKLANVETYLDSRMEPESVFEFGASHVVIAAGSTWRKDGVGRSDDTSISEAGAAMILTPDDIMAGRMPHGRVVVYDDDHFYMGGVIAEAVRKAGADVTIATPAPDVSHWTHNTLEQTRIQARMIELGIQIRPHATLLCVDSGAAEFECVFTGRRSRIETDWVILVTSREPNDHLYHSLLNLQSRFADSGIRSVGRIGDCLVPGTIAAAVHSGHMWARNLGEHESADVLTTPFKREHAAVNL